MQNMFLKTEIYAVYKPFETGKIPLFSAYKAATHKKHNKPSVENGKILTRRSFTDLFWSAVGGHSVESRQCKNSMSPTQIEWQGDFERIFPAL